jgi:hypothetical protein
MKLEEIISKYGVPDPKIVGKLPKGGMQLDFVGHADTQKALSEIDPTWTMEPTAFDEFGLPAFRVENGMAHMAGMDDTSRCPSFGCWFCSCTTSPISTRNYSPMHSGIAR